ncbi:MAG: class I SAM-dependent RNA methyltransferase [Bdellovibrionales bacterium]|nr:class I SAM-dependent RNA methyltransferase [Bdellovibrionales bacterium]
MDTFSGRIRGLSSEGLGVVEHPDGRVFFVAGTWPGDLGEFTIERVEKRYGYARLSKMVEASPDRVTPPCPHQGWERGSCGGCPWMIGSYESQLQFKQHRVRHALERASLLTDDKILLPILGSQPLGYRNRAQVKTDGKRLGFVSESSREIASVDDCIVLTEPMREKLQTLIRRLPELRWAPADGYNWNFIDIDEATAVSPEPVLNRRRPFRQGNEAQNDRMRSWLRDHLRDLPRDNKLLELYAGSGNFTEVASSLGFTDIVAFEVGRDSIDALEARGLPGVRAFESDLAHPAALRVIPRDHARTTVLVLDPPRTGSKGIEKIAADLADLAHIFYISCDPATFVRDAAALASKGFALREVQPMDMFPQTSHVETLAHFVRKDQA